MKKSYMSHQCIECAMYELCVELDDVTSESFACENFEARRKKA